MVDSATPSCGGHLGHVEAPCPDLRPNGGEVVCVWPGPPGATEAEFYRGPVAGKLRLPGEEEAEREAR